MTQQGKEKKMKRFVEETHAARYLCTWPKSTYNFVNEMSSRLLIFFSNCPQNSEESKWPGFESFSDLIHTILASSDSLIIHNCLPYTSYNTNCVSLALIFFF